MATLMDFLQSGDTLMVTRIDRLARSIGDLQDIVRALKLKAVTLKATEQPIDTSSAGKAFLDMLGVFAEFETNLRKERQMEGIKAAKARGVYKGRRPKIDTGEIRKLKTEGIGHAEIAAVSALGERACTAHWKYPISRRCKYRSQNRNFNRDIRDKVRLLNTAVAGIRGPRQIEFGSICAVLAQHMDLNFPIVQKASLVEQHQV